MSALLERHIRPEVLAALADTRVVVILGARQVGKSTLVDSLLANEFPAQSLSFDTLAVRRAATEDPTTFIADLRGPVAIDEVHRVPDVILAIKQRVDRDRTPGQFLLTGSANLLTAPGIADGLTGRAQYLRLGPLSQGELIGRRETFLEALFAGEPPRVQDAPVGRSAYAKQIITGGFPDAQGRSANRLERYFSSYVDTLMLRDLDSIAPAVDADGMSALFAAVAATSGSVFSASGLATRLDVSTKTVQSRMALLETLFVVSRLPGFSNNLLSRVVKAPKFHTADSGLLAAVLNVDEAGFAARPEIAGMLTETFAVGELLRQLTWFPGSARAYHFRDSAQREIDIVIERADGQVIAIEVKASASLRGTDSRSLRYLRDHLGSRFAGGVMLYTGESTLPISDRLWAVPLSGLWT